MDQNGATDNTTLKKVTLSKVETQHYMLTMLINKGICNIAANETLAHMINNIG